MTWVITMITVFTGFFVSKITKEYELLQTVKHSNSTFSSRD